MEFNRVGDFHVLFDCSVWVDHRLKNVGVK